MNPFDFDLDATFDEITRQRNYYIDKYHLTCDDLWVLMAPAVHNAFLKYSKRTSEGPDRITRSCVLGMHVIHDKVKKVYVVPKKRPPKEEFGFYE